MSDANRTQARGEYPGRFASAQQAVWLIGLLAATVVLIYFAGEPARDLLRYEREAVLVKDEYWRLLTGHFVHGDLRHMLLNLAGLGLMPALFPRHYSLFAWLWIAAASIAAIDIGFVWYEPQLDWYVGLSGALHGVLAAGAIAWWRYESRALALALTLILALKIAWEQTQGALPLSGDMPVIVDAHLYGALGGVLCPLVLWSCQQSWPLRRR
jgi:rhomboid family GlyGly-CTERM serine protease